jgi:hypothetical protein
MGRASSSPVKAPRKTSATTAKKSAAKKPAAKKPAAKKPAAKKAAAKKPAAKKPAAKKAPMAATSMPLTSSTNQSAARVEALSSVFTALGAREPERWARSHVEHGLDQIGRYVFLRALWSRVVKDGRFLDKLRHDPGETRAVVERLLMAGAREADLVALVRALQVHLLVDVAQILDDPSDNDEGVRWGLWRMDKRGLPLWQLPDLRLDLLEVDPADDV